MNIQTGTERLFIVVLIIIGVLFILVVGGTTINFAFIDAAPNNLQISGKVFQDCIFGAALGSVGLLIGLERLSDQYEVSELQWLVLGTWAVCASFFGWLIAFFSILSTAGGWSPPLGLFSGYWSSGIPTVVLSAVIWVLPLLVVMPAIWIGRGFRGDT